MRRIYESKRAVMPTDVYDKLEKEATRYAEEKNPVDSTEEMIFKSDYFRQMFEMPDSVISVAKSKREIVDSDDLEDVFVISFYDFSPDGNAYSTAYDNVEEKFYFEIDDI